MPGDAQPPMNLLMTYLPNMNIHAWVDQLGTLSSHTTAVVVGDPEYRFDLYQSIAAEHTLVVGPPYSGTLVQRLDLQPHIENLVRLVNLQADQGLVSMIDHGYYPAITRAFEMLWGARFLYADDGTLDVKDLAQWSLRQHSDTLSLVDSCDVLCLWLTLAKANDLLHRVIIPIEDHHSEENTALMEAAERWSGLGCPLGLLIGSAKFETGFRGHLVLQ